MQIGDLVQSLQGNWRRVVAITPVANQETVYNFTVDQNHDYFVGETGFLVHNAGNCDCEPGDFSISDWTDYPEGVPRPAGPFNLLFGDAYDAARSAANAANRGLHLSDPGTYGGMDIHENQPVKFGGSPTDLENKIPLPRSKHSLCTNWWNALQRGIE